MSRLYTNYLNHGRGGLTWAALVGTTLACNDGAWLTCRAIAEEIWGRSGPPPLALISQVNAALDRLIDNKLVVFQRIKAGVPTPAKYEYGLTEAGLDQFGAIDYDQWTAANHTDSELFKPGHKAKKATRNNIVKFQPVKRVG